MIVTAIIIFIIFVIMIGTIENSNSFSYFFGRGKIKEKEKFIEVSFDSFLILKEAIRISENKYFRFKKDSLPALVISERKPYKCGPYNFSRLEEKENIVLFFSFKDYLNYFHWLKKYFKEEDKKEKQETIKNNFAKDTVIELIKDLENFAEQEKKESADKFEQVKNTFNEVNKK